MPAGYALTWSDEFNTDGLPDPTLWSYDTALNKTGWYNSELEYYSANRSENARVESGHLVIEARKEDLSSASDWGGQHYTSARLLSKKTWTYGYSEIKAWVPCPKGAWPAAWQLPAAPHNAWPKDGEVDIMEYVGWNPGKVYQTIHDQLYNGANGQQKGIIHDLPDVCGAWHLYQMTWTHDYIKLGIDGRNYLRYNNDGTGNYDEWPFDNPQFMILNLAVGGTFGGVGGVDDASLPWQYLVDYVRVYQAAP